MPTLSDSHHELIVAEQNGEVVGTLHLIFLPSLSCQGGTRAQIESVRVDSRVRNQGVGREMMLHAIQRAAASQMLDESRVILDTLQKRGVLTLDVPANQLSMAVINRYLALKARTML